MTDFQKILTELKKHAASVSCIDYSVIEPGLCMEEGSVFQNLLRELKKQ